MKKLNESRPPEVGTRMRHNLFPAKSVTNIVTWNVRSLYKTGGLAQLIREMRNYDLQILGISEMRWTGSGMMSSKGVTVLHSGGLSHEREVEVLLNGEASRSLLGWEAVSDRLLTVTLQAKIFNTTIIHVYMHRRIQRKMTRKTTSTNSCRDS